MRNSTVLIIDDERDIRDLVSDILSDEGFQCYTASNSDEALLKIRKNTPNIILLDIWLQNSNLDGLAILEIIKQEYPMVPVIMISGHGTIETAVNAIKIGAYDYIEKPFTADKLSITVKRANEAITLKRENTELKKKIVKNSELVGSSPALQKLKQDIANAAVNASRILVQGEIGSGKELVAQLIHKQSENRSSPFIKINSAVFSNANSDQDIMTKVENSLNILETINQATLFITEVTKLPLHVQHKILKLLKSKSIQNKKIKIIASTSVDVKSRAKSGIFLQDLFSKLNGTVVQVPSLSDRREDIPELCKYFINQLTKTTNLDYVEFAEATLKNLEQYHWPGNVRQLKNVVEWLMITSRAEQTDVANISSLPAYMLSNNAFQQESFEMCDDIISMPLRRAREEFERKYLSIQMKKFNNNISKTSSFVGMERSALHRKLKLLNIHHTDKSFEGEFDDLLADTQTGETV